MFPRKNFRKEEEQPDLMDRLLTAILAPIFFNVAVLIVVFVFFSKSKSMKFLFVRGVPTSATGLSTTTILIGIPALVGFIGGSIKFVKFLGHSFLTNSPAEQDWIKTLGIWLIIFFAAFVLSHVLSA